MNCNMLQNLFSFSIVKRFHQFEELEVSCPALEKLELNGCHKLKYVFTSSMVKSFVHLKTLDISECDEMEGVIEGTLAAEEEEGISSSIRLFPKLDSLSLSSLPKLKRFGRVINPIEFPSLKGLMIRDCCALNTFTFDDGKSRVTPPHYLFDERISCPALEVLALNGCHKLKYVFISSMVKSFVHLKTLNAYNCAEMEEVIEGTLAAEEEEGISSSIRLFAKLVSLSLSSLPKLKRFGVMENLERLWADQLVEHSFFKLTSIELSDCPKLLNVFPLSLLTRLQKLEILEIYNCESVEEIIYGGGSSSSGGMPSLSPQFIQSFEFSNLTSLVLYDLPNLKSIHHNKMHTINWPSLKQLRVDECYAVEILFSNSGETSSEQLRFWVNESTFPNIQKLTLRWHCNSQQQQQLLSPYFPNLKLVQLWRYPKEVTVLPSYLLSLPNLQTLEIISSDFKEMIFQSEEGGEEKPASLLLSQITELRLDDLPELRHLWKEKEGFPNLRILYVDNCPEVKANLVPSSVSFRNLVTLVVYECNGIIKLITHSTAKSLVQLQEMSIWECQNIEEIIQGGDDDDEISFPQLNSLDLRGLPKLESFCSSDKYTFGFSSLQFLLLKDCPKMKMFSQGNSNTPLLHKIQLNIDEERWEGNLNSTIQNLFREKHVMIDEYEDSEEDESNSLITIESEECENSNEDQRLATYFQGSMKFDADRSVSFSCPLGVMNTTTAELQAIKMGMEVSCPALEELKLNGCRKLKYVFTSSLVKSFVHLKTLEISNCDEMEEIIEETLEVIFPVLEKLEIGFMENLERLWADQRVEHSFSKLTFVMLRSCPKLNNFFPLSMLTRLQRLEILKIWECESVEEIIYGGGSSSSSGGMPSLSPQFIQSEVEFPNLTFFSLYELSNLRSIHHNKTLTINWPSLKKLIVRECNRTEILFANSQETISQQPLFWSE
ncbi:hypothetical protein V6N13_103216 [Hibiscus sabdariffa]